MAYICGQHKFNTEKIDEWNKHIESQEHTVKGTAPCKLCGFITEFSFTGKKKADSIPAICDECREKI